MKRGDRPADAVPCGAIGADRPPAAAVASSVPAARAAGSGNSSRIRSPFAAAIFVGGALAGGLMMGSGCSEDCCTLDSLPIRLTWAPVGVATTTRPGGLLAQARSTAIQNNQPFAMSIDTGSPLTVSNGSADGSNQQTVSRSFDILGAAPDTATRASFRGIDTLTVPLGTIGDATTQPAAVFGSDLLRGFSIELRFDLPSITFWSNQRAGDGFLAEVGYAVIHFIPFGGGEITATGDPDLLDMRGPVNVAPSRIVFRTCAAPDPFDVTVATQQLCCQAGDDIRNASGTPLALLLATGAGPLILSDAAWTRMLPGLSPVPPLTDGSLSLYLASAPKPLNVRWTTLPASAHLALVNQETTDVADPGPCVELARSRRIEWVAYRQAKFPELAACVQPCDMDPNDTGKAQNSAAYVELGAPAGEEIPVAVLYPNDPYLEGLRADIRPEGPEIDGIIGAGVLAHTRVELDYRSSSMRAIFSCDDTSDRNVCWAGPRCPRLPDHTQTHTCFGYAEAALPATCADNMCGK